MIKFFKPTIDHCLRSLPLAAIFFIITGCETIVEVDIPEQKPLLVSNSFFSPDYDWQVHLSKSVGILDNSEIEPVTNATVEILHNNQLIATLNHEGDGFYHVANRKPRVGLEYTMKASAPGYETILAADRVPEPVDVEMVDVISSVNMYGVPQLDLTVHFQDPPDIKNYYEVSVYGQAPQGYINFIYFRSKDPAITQGNSQIEPGEDNEFSGFSALFDDAIFPGNDYNLELSVELYDTYNLIYVELSSVSETLYHYSRSSELQSDTNENPFAEPVQIPHNVQNGLGIFGAYSSDRFVIRN